MMSIRLEAPTVNEILYQRQDRIRNCMYRQESYRYARFAKGESVEFEFSGMKRTGVITAIHHDGPITLYGIVTQGEGWYRCIEESNVRHLAAAL